MNKEAVQREKLLQFDNNNMRDERNKRYNHLSNEGLIRNGDIQY